MAEISHFPRRYEYGNLDTDSLLRKLKQEGLKDIKVDRNSSGGYIIHLVREIKIQYLKGTEQDYSILLVVISFFFKTCQCD